MASYTYKKNKLHLKGMELEVINSNGEAFTHSDGKSASIHQARKVTLDASTFGKVVTLTDLSNGTLEINNNAGSVQTAVRPGNELNYIGTLDTTADRVHIYDASTGNEMWTRVSDINAPEVFRSPTPLTGVAPVPFKVGIDFSTGTQYYVNTAGNWQAFPVGTTVVVTDLVNGEIRINAGLGGDQNAIRPVSELATQTVVNTTDFLAGFDGTTHKRFTIASILAKTTHTMSSAVNTMTSIVNGITATAQIVLTNTLAIVGNNIISTVNGVQSAIALFSNTLPLADGVADTRAGSVGIASTVARIDHIHPIAYMAIPALPNISVSGKGTFNSQTIGLSQSSEQYLHYTVFLNWTTNSIGTWAQFAMPNIPGYTLVNSNANTYDQQGNSLSLARMINGVTNYTNPSTYYAEVLILGRSIFTTFNLTYRLN